MAAKRGRVGERYILGGENLSLKAILGLLSEITGLPAPRFRTPYAVAWAFGFLDTARARFFGGTPFAPLDAIRMARHAMYFDSAKAVAQLRFRPRPAREALVPTRQLGRGAARAFLLPNGAQ